MKGRVRCPRARTARAVFLSLLATLSLCVLSGVALVPAFAQPAPPPVTYVQASNIACKVGRPNVKPGETVIYQGGCADGFAQGRGMAQWFLELKPTLRFEGTYARGLLEGKGTMIGADGDRYDGDYKAGLRHGHGIYVSANGARFEGEYVNNQRGGAAPASPSANPPVAQNQAVQTPAPVAPTPNSPPASAPQPTAAIASSPSRTPSGDFAMVGCGVVAVATKEMLRLPIDDEYAFFESGVWPGESQAKWEAVAKSNGLRLAKEARVFATKNAASCRPSGFSFRPGVSEIVLIFTGRIPEKVPAVDKDTATSVPGLLVLANYSSTSGGLWLLYNIAY